MFCLNVRKIFFCFAEKVFQSLNHYWAYGMRIFQLPKGCTVLHTGLISCSTGTSIRARGPDCPALGSQRGSSYHELRTLLPPNKSYQVRLASVEPRTSRRHVRHNFITSEGEIPVQCLTTEPRPDDVFSSFPNLGIGQNSAQASCRYRGRYIGP
jgi:hypothetical protein